MQIDANRDLLARWDREYSAQGHDKLDGGLLAKDNFTLFRQYRSKGLNHNPVCEFILADNVEGLKGLIASGMSIDSDIPLSLFDRFKHGRSVRIKLIEYCALTAKSECFNYLYEAGAAVGEMLAHFAARGGTAEMIRLCDEKRCSFAQANIGAVKGYHISVLRYVTDTKAQPISGRCVLEMCRFRYKGLHYLGWVKGANLTEILMTDPKFGRTSDRVYSALAVRLAMHNELMLMKILAHCDGFNVMKKTLQKYSTPVHAAAAKNAIEILEFLIGLPTVDINASDKSGTPLICAAQNNAWEAVRLLIQKPGIQLNAIANDVPSVFKDPL
jgi:hypothetical protein